MTARVDRYSPGEPVRVLVRLPDDDRKGQTGHVERTYADAGDMVHRVMFADGQMADYYISEIKSTRTPW
ncbi:hypothetical protein ABQE93_10925 [Mycolicibacterium sp. XJ662]